MKKFSSIFFLILLTARVCSAEEYHFVSIENLAEQEVGRIVLTEIYKNLNINITITPRPGKRAQEDAASGKKDGEIMRIWTYGLETPTTIRVPTPYYYLETMAFVKKDSGITINSKADLEKYRLAKVRGIKHTDNITRDMPHVHTIGRTEKMMLFLELGRADVALTNTLDGIIALKKINLDNIISTGKPLAVLGLYHYIHEDHKELVAKVDAMIKKMGSSGELKELIGKAEKQVIANK